AQALLQHVGPVGMVGGAQDRLPLGEVEVHAVGVEDVDDGVVRAAPGVGDEAVEVEDQRARQPHAPGAGGSAAQDTRASTSPSMVWTSASTATSSPFSRADAAVTGPGAATTGGRGRPPAAARRLATVDDEVNVTISASASA